MKADLRLQSRYHFQMKYVPPHTCGILDHVLQSAEWDTRTARQSILPCFIERTATDHAETSFYQNGTMTSMRLSNVFPAIDKSLAFIEASPEIGCVNNAAHEHLLKVLPTPCYDIESRVAHRIRPLTRTCQLPRRRITVDSDQCSPSKTRTPSLHRRAISDLVLPIHMELHEDSDIFADGTCIHIRC